MTKRFETSLCSRRIRTEIYWPIRKEKFIMCTIHCHCDDDCCGSGSGCSPGSCCAAFWKGVGYFFMYLFIFIFYIIFFAFCHWVLKHIFFSNYFSKPLKSLCFTPSYKTHKSIVCPPMWLFLCFCPPKYRKWIWTLWCLKAICGGGGIEDAMVWKSGLVW